MAAEEEPKDIEEGALVPGRVSRTVAGTGLIVDLGHGRSGRVALTGARSFSYFLSPEKTGGTSLLLLQALRSIVARKVMFLCRETRLFDTF